MTKLPKFMERKLAGVKWPMLLISKEKHAYRYMLIDDRDSLYREALAIITDRKDHWYSEPDEFQVDHETESLDVGSIPSLVRREAETAKARYENRKRAYAQAAEQWKQIELAVSSGDGSLAWLILNQRVDHEYEGVELRAFDNARKR